MPDTTVRREVVVDTRLAELYTTINAYSRRIESEYDTLHRLAGERQRHVGKRRVWPTTGQEAERVIRAAVAPDEWSEPPTVTLTPWDTRSALAALDRLDSHRAERAPLYAERDQLDTEYAANPWSRFFLVRNNGGHIHSSLSCSTCRITTEFGWLPNLSGLTEADAVAEHGAILCTVCYPSAPVEWTRGLEKPAGCAGSGKAPVEGTYKRRGMSAYGKCQECDTTQTVTSTYRIRKHKP